MGEFEDDIREIIEPASGIFVFHSHEFIGHQHHLCNLPSADVVVFQYLQKVGPPYA